jgi:hypothetical protein
MLRQYLQIDTTAGFESRISANVHPIENDLASSQQRYSTEASGNRGLVARDTYT